MSSPADASTRAVEKRRAPAAHELGARLFDQRLVEVRDGRRRTERGRGLERVETRVGEVVDRADLLDAGAVDLLDLTHEQVEGDLLAQQHRELVDGDVVAALEDVDADDVAFDRTDARRDQTECAGAVGEPHPHEDVGGLLVGVAHGTDATAEDDANVSPR